MNVPLFSLCPFRSPVEIPEERNVFRADGAKPSGKAREALGPCLGAACGLWCVTRVENGQPVDGMCSLKLAAAAVNAIAGKYVGPPQEKPSLSVVPPETPSA